MLERQRRGGPGVARRTAAYRVHDHERRVFRRPQQVVHLGWRAELLKSDAGERSEEHTSELQSQSNLVCRLLLEKKKKNIHLCLEPGQDNLHRLNESFYASVASYDKLTPIMTAYVARRHHALHVSSRAVHGV